MFVNKQAHTYIISNVLAELFSIFGFGARQVLGENSV